MRWKALSIALLLILFLQCGEDSTNSGNAQGLGTPVSAEMYELFSAEEAAEFRFPSDTKAVVGFRMTRIEDELRAIEATPVFTTDGTHNLADRFVTNTELLRVIVYR